MWPPGNRTQVLCQSHSLIFAAPYHPILSVAFVFGKMVKYLTSYWILNKVNTLTQVHFHLRNVENYCFDTLGRMGKRGISTWFSVYFHSQWSLDKAVYLNHRYSKCLRQTVVAHSLRSCPSPAGEHSHETATYLPPSLLPRCWRGFRDVDGLLQGSPQVHSPLLDHLADVLYPVLLVLNTGRLCRRESIRRRCPSRLCPAHVGLPCFPTENFSQKSRHNSV